MTAQKPIANYEGFTDSTGKHMDYEAGLREAARWVAREGDTTFIAELMRDSLAPDDILQWLVYPDTGEFGS